MNSRRADGPSQQPAVTGVVLAGGDSTRFGEADKALAAVAGEPILAGVAATLRRATGRPPVVAAGPGERRSTYRPHLPPDVDFVDDAADFDGPLAGVVGAAEAVSTPWLFVVGCDMPRLSADAVRWLLEGAGEPAAVGTGTDAAVDAIAVAGPDGTVESLHAGYRRSAVLAARDRLPATAGVRALFDVLAATRVVPGREAPPDVDLDASLSNVNTRAELDAVRDRTAGGE